MESTVDPCTATTWPAVVRIPSTSPVPITDVSAMSVARSASGAATSWSVASCRPTPAMKPASDARWPSSRLDAMDALSAALFSACVRALASASIRGTTAMAIPATRITAANFKENEAPRQMPVSLRTPRIDVPQLDRRSSTRDTAATVAATRTMVRAITGAAPTPSAPVAPTGVTPGTVSSGGARTGGLELCGLLFARGHGRGMGCGDAVCPRRDHRGRRRGVTRRGCGGSLRGRRRR